jgi:rhomboid family GlyGly-CTERM serine protease
LTRNRNFAAGEAGRIDPPLRLALAGAAVIVLLQAVPAAAPWLEYRRASIGAEPWRLLTGHLVHLNWTHALVNAGAWLALAHLFGSTLDARRQAVVLVLGALGTAVALATLDPSIAWYRGASGALHALFFAGAGAALREAVRCDRVAATWIAAALLAGGAIKLALEFPQAGQTPHAAWLGAPVVPQAHLAGAAIGAALGLRFGRRRERRAISG